MECDARHFVLNLLAECPQEQVLGSSSVASERRPRGRGLGKRRFGTVDKRGRCRHAACHETSVRVRSSGERVHHRHDDGLVSAPSKRLRKRAVPAMFPAMTCPAIREQGSVCDPLPGVMRRPVHRDNSMCMRPLRVCFTVNLPGWRTCVVCTARRVGEEPGRLGYPLLRTLHWAQVEKWTAPQD